MPVLEPKEILMLKVLKVDVFLKQLVDLLVVNELVKKELLVGNVVDSVLKVESTTAVIFMDWFIIVVLDDELTAKDYEEDEVSSSIVLVDIATITVEVEVVSNKVLRHLSIGMHVEVIVQEAVMVMAKGILVVEINGIAKNVAVSVPIIQDPNISSGIKEHVELLPVTDEASYEVLLLKRIVVKVHLITNFTILHTDVRVLQVTKEVSVSMVRMKEVSVCLLIVDVVNSVVLENVMLVIDHVVDMVSVAGMVVIISGIVEGILEGSCEEAKEVGEMLAKVRQEVVDLALSWNQVRLIDKDENSVILEHVDITAAI